LSITRRCFSLMCFRSSFGLEDLWQMRLAISDIIITLSQQLGRCYDVRMLLKHTMQKLMPEVPTSMA
jgi:hypothetical protein